MSVDVIPPVENVGTKVYSAEDIASQLVYLDRAHKMTSSDPVAKETPYSRSAGMIRQLLASNGENS